MTGIERKRHEDAEHIVAGKMNALVLKMWELFDGDVEPDGETQEDLEKTVRQLNHWWKEYTTLTHQAINKPKETK